MTELSRHIQDDRGIEKMPTARTREAQKGESRTAGENRDFDESRVSDNQRHGHPREEHRPQTRRASRLKSEETGGRQGRPADRTGRARGLPGGDQGMGKGAPKSGGG